MGWRKSGLILVCAGALLGAGAPVARAQGNAAAPGETVEQGVAADQGAAAAEPANAPLEQVEVLGERPGPQMWKVVKGDHTLWILCTLSPLPKNMKWRAKPVEDVLAVSQELISGEVDLDAGLGPISGLRLYRQWRRVRNNADGATSQQVMPPPLYSRFSALKAKYAPRDDALDRLQPMFAGGRLFREAVKASRLTSDRFVQKTVIKLAKKHDVKIRKIKVPVEDPRGLLEEVGETPLPAQLICLSTTLSRLETDVSTMAARAEAWAIGDVDALRNLPHVNEDEACWAAVSETPRIKKVGERVRYAYIAAMEDSLQKNKSTLALLSIERLLGPQGVLERFKAKGYSIEGP